MRQQKCAGSNYSEYLQLLLNCWEKFLCANGLLQRGGDKRMIRDKTENRERVNSGALVPSIHLPTRTLLPITEISGTDSVSLPLAPE